MLTLIGSRAMKHWYPDAREPHDWDYQSGTKYHDPVYLSMLPEPRDIFVDSRLGLWDWRSVADPNELYTLKISHSFWDINGTWNKHAGDIVFLQRKGCVFIRELYDILLPIWRERYARHKTSLKQNAGDFFNDAVDRKYEHDSLHESVAYYDRPLFESILKDGEDVAVDNRKFFNGLGYSDQLRCVREEIYATALERKLIPGNYQGSPRAAYWWALRRTATSLFKGEWALFLMLHLDELRQPDCDYMRRHLNNLDRLRPAGGTHE